MITRIPSIPGIKLPLLVACCLSVGLVIGFPPHSRAQMSISSAIKVGKTPSRVAISPIGTAIYVSNSEDGTISIISTSTNKVVETKYVGKRPGAIVFSTDGAKAYIGLQGDDKYQGSGVVIFDTARREASRSIAVSGGRDCPVVDLAIHPDGKKIYLALVYCGLYKLDTDSHALSRIDPTILFSCPEAIAFTPDGRYAYVNYQCAPPPGARGHDPIFIFDAQADVPIGAITHISTRPGAKRIANVGSFLTISPDGRQAWANGIDACARSNSQGLGGYDFKGCPPLTDLEREEVEKEGYTGRGIINIINLETRQVEAKGFPARESGSKAGLGASVPTFFPDGKQVAVSTEGRILIFDAGSLNQIGTGLAIPRASNLVFTKDQRRAYVASATGNAVYPVRLAPEPEVAWYQRITRLYWKLWEEDFWKTLVSHAGLLQLALFIFPLFSIRFARAFSRVRYILLLVEADIYFRGARSRLVRYYLGHLTRDILERRKKQNAMAFVSLPVKRGSQRTTTDTWLHDVGSAMGSAKQYRAAILGSGGTGKTFLMEELVLHLVEQGRVPILIQAVDYANETSFQDWIQHVLERAQLPIRADLLQTISSLVLLVDQVSEVRVANQENFWSLLAGQSNPGAARASIILSGRPIEAYRRVVSQSLDINDNVDLDEDLSDDDIIRLGTAYFDPSGESEEVKALPKTIRSITTKPTAFIVTQYAKARIASSRPITRPEDLYEEILDRYIRLEASLLRPDVVKSVLQGLVERHYGQSGNRGIPLDRGTLEREAGNIFESEDLARRFGSNNIPTPREFVDQLLVSGLVYRTQSSHLFFHDSFEDWLLQESRRTQSLR